MKLIQEENRRIYVLLEARVKQEIGRLVGKTGGIRHKNLW